MSNGDPTAADNFKKLRDEWKDQIEELTGLVDMATNATDFIRESGKYRFMLFMTMLRPLEVFGKEFLRLANSKDPFFYSFTEEVIKRDCETAELALKQGNLPVSEFHFKELCKRDKLSVTNDVNFWFLQVLS